MTVVKQAFRAGKGGGVENILWTQLGAELISSVLVLDRSTFRYTCRIGFSRCVAMQPLHS